MKVIKARKQIIQKDIENIYIIGVIYGQDNI